MGLPMVGAHNIVVGPESGYVVAMGAQPRDSACKSRLIFVDMKPLAPGVPGKMDMCTSAPLSLP